ncbi:maestro heat-like repeat-containing protein family member 7 [Chelonia mydas]|uniref:maestro heat-like repeat-containing protein family member 7 n=1 Tax=Chelonia mydas TaxID=8469 RepID=UPI001CA97832|nr:maestro heat-like repeat-containing protein family member 7 [Chelonia mydas]
MELSSLLNLCFSSTFSLPPAETNQGVEAALYNNTLNTMDELLKALVCEDEKPNLVVLQNIVEVLLPWTASKEVHVRLRAVGRITWLTKFISGQHQFKGLEEFRVLGQLVGCLTLLCAEQEQEICRSAMEGLHHLYAFLLWQKRTTLAKQSAEYLQVFREWRAENTFWVTWFTNTSNIAMMHWVSSKPDPSSLSGVVGASPEINALQGIIASTHQCQPLLSTRECIRAVQYCAPVHCHAGLCHVRQLLIAAWVLCIPGAVTQPCPGRAGFACTPGWASPGCSVRLEPHWAAKGVSLAGFFQMFGKYFNPSERMDFLLTAIEGMRDTSVHDSVAARHMLHVILWVPSPSLERVSEAVTSIYHNLDSISEPLAQQQLLKALVVLGHQYSEEVVTTLLGCSLSCDSVAVEMWRVLTSHPKTAGKVLRELLNRLQERPLHPHHDVSQQEAGVAPLAIGKLQRQLPVVVERLHEADRDVISNAITVLRDILAGMDRQSASPVAVQVAEKLLPFFHDESSKLRVLSIALFKHLLELVRGPSRRKMKEHVLRSLVPLLLLLHDERPNVSQVCWDTLRSALEFLRWSQLSALVQKKELWRGCDCLVACYKGRAETFLCQAMAFLEDPQDPIREAAIRFLGLTARQLDQQSQEKLEAICNVLKGLQQDSKSSVRCLALQTMLILNACKKHRPARTSLRTLLHRMRLMHTRENPVIEAAQLPE